MNSGLKMRVLLITTDLYRSVGGGQSVYRKIIESSPDVDYFYFVTDEVANSEKPENAHPIPLLGPKRLRVNTPPPFPAYHIAQLEDADRFARSVAGQSFDIVDIPDFYTFGSALRSALVHHKVIARRIVLAMHGNISDSIYLNWGSAGDRVLEHRVLELSQFKESDAVYGISQRYIQAWRKKLERTVKYIDPAHFVRRSEKISSVNSTGLKPSLYCIGRMERRKGNDLFVELVRWVGQGRFERAAHIGDADYSDNGISSAYLLGNIAKQREIEIEQLPAMSPAEMHALYAQRSILVLPVRYDTLNLVALEALFSGCPVAISDKAGVCDYLDQAHPGLPYVKMDFDNFYGSVEKIQNLIENYDQHREALLAYLTSSPTVPSQPLNMAACYEELISMSPDESRVGLTAVTLYEEAMLLPGAVLVRTARKLLPKHTYHALRQLLRAPNNFVGKKIKQSGYAGDAKFLSVLTDASSLPSRLKRISGESEYSKGRVREKLNEIYGNASSPLYRCNFWLDIARLERELGNDLMAVTYELRVLRLLGEDRLGLLPRVVETLNNRGFTGEARVADAMFRDPSSAEERVYSYLKETYQRNLNLLDKAWQTVVDGRSAIPPRVSVIVSLYKAADKLNFFLTALEQQTLVKKGAVEIVLVDSGSPTDEGAVFRAYTARSQINAVYARSPERETIQAAWNRGIRLARAPYLVFLGVDETLYPEALEVLSEELDKNPEVDWVMANSLVTEVETNGVYKNDVMPYRRDGAGKDHTYLETCYLSWVGGMYRRSIHDRFGYYDESFGAAGDTEIKNRILPYINVKFVPKMLGLFLNYPDGQTTASPKAEIEDSRAWYAHRTPGGIRYAFENRSLEDAERQLCLALGYRKSFCGHMSCDIEYATYLARYIKNRDANSRIANAVLPGLENMLTEMRRLEFAEINPSKSGSRRLMFRTWRSAAQHQAEHRSALQSVSWPCYNVLNDNRYEQHSWLWKST
jgi:glycosyltransferase involved in cell wall biosynthesis